MGVSMRTSSNMHIIFLLSTLLMAALVASQKNRKCTQQGLECYSEEMLEPGTLYTIESKKCGKKGRYPGNDYCYWGFEVKDCIPTVHCDYIDIKGRGKRCRGDNLSIYTSDWGKDVCGKKQDGTFPPETVVQQGYLDIVFYSNRRKHGKGFQCQVYCEETAATTTEETPAPPTGETQTPPTGETASPPTGETAVPTTTTSSSSCSCGVANRATRIVGGVVTEVNEYPWQVGLIDTSSGRPYCGGSILSSKTILTAAHCTAGYDARSLTVVVAEHDWTANDGEQRFSVCGKTEHPSYDSGTVDYDFSILTLCSEITFQQDASPVCLPAQPGPAYDGVPAVVSGWGTLAAGGFQPTQLMGVDVQTMTNSACNSAYRGAITDSMICATNPGKDACQGDSGGPLVSMESGDYYSQIGVVSWGYGCADPDYPGVYARVTAVSSFIQDNIRGSTCPPPTA